MFIFLQALLVPAEAEVHQRPAVWKALPTATAVTPVLNYSCSVNVFLQSRCPVFNRLHCVLMSSSLLHSKSSFFKRILELLIIEFPFVFE